MDNCVCLCSIRKEYEEIVDKALTTPSNTQHLMELKEFRQVLRPPGCLWRGSPETAIPICFDVARGVTPVPGTAVAIGATAEPDARAIDAEEARYVDLARPRDHSAVVAHQGHRLPVPSLCIPPYMMDVERRPVRDCPLSSLSQ